MFTAASALLWLAFAAWSDWSGARKLAAGGLAGVPGPLAIAVTLNFAPEQFHMTMLQQVGRMVGVQGDTIHLADVPAMDARMLAREYWVAAVRRDGK